jgi:hypothetical protein
MKEWWCGVRTVWLPDYITCANTTLSVEFRDYAGLPQVT